MGDGDMNDHSSNFITTLESFNLDTASFRALKRDIASTFSLVEAEHQIRIELQTQSKIVNSVNTIEQKKGKSWAFFSTEKQPKDENILSSIKLERNSAQMELKRNKMLLAELRLALSEVFDEVVDNTDVQDGGFGALQKLVCDSFESEQFVNSHCSKIGPTKRPHASISSVKKIKKMLATKDTPIAMRN